MNETALMNSLEPRTGEGAQPEIQRYAQAISSMVKEIVPISYEAFENHLLKANASHG
ncbi:MAG: FAD-dependent thymidylate synthase [Dehalococcoidia bacterium]